MSLMPNTVRLQLANDIHAVRRFNRLYTRRIGVLEEDWLQSPFSLTEGRVLFELAQQPRVTARALGETLGLDAGYLSRMLRSFRKRGLVTRAKSASDARQQLLTLTAEGRKAFSALNAASQKEVGKMLRPLAPDARTRLVHAMDTVEALLSESSAPPAEYTLRQHQPGDMGWIVERHAVLYHREYGFDSTMEALASEIVANFLRNYNSERERCWIAERAGERVGSVFLMQHPGEPNVAKLRLLLVEPSARGLGIGARLVSECTRFAREVGYERITLWTNSVLAAARHLYEQEGYRLLKEERHRSFGPELTGQTWELTLR
jgi:DNA-binding MarR family transcriptional regulator/GNAT superfamily N-acetyltransferase